MASKTHTRSWPAKTRSWSACVASSTNGRGGTNRHEIGKPEKTGSARICAGLSDAQYQGVALLLLQPLLPIALAQSQQAANGRQAIDHRIREPVTDHGRRGPANGFCPLLADRPVERHPG